MNFDFTSLLVVIIVMFLMLVIGFFCRKIGWIDDAASKRLSTLIIKVGQPMMIIDALVNVEYTNEPVKGAFLCPSSQGELDPAYPGQGCRYDRSQYHSYKGTNYGQSVMTRNLNWNGIAANIRLLKYTKIVNPSRFFVYADTYANNGPDLNCLNPCRPNFSRHQGNANIGYGDGHVGTIAETDGIIDDQTANGPWLAGN